MLAKTSYKPVTLPGVEKPVTPLSPEGHYLFLPSDNNSLLLKSIAVSELMLPNDFQSSVEGPSDSALSAVASCLDQVKFFFHIYIYIYKHVENTSWKVLAYGIYSPVDVSEIERVSPANE